MVTLRGEQGDRRRRRRSKARWRVLLCRYVPSPNLRGGGRAKFRNDATIGNVSTELGMVRRLLNSRCGVVVREINRRQTVAKTQ